MKNLIFVATALIFSAPAFAGSKQVVAGISFKNGSTSHEYTLVQEGENPGFKLIFQEGRKKPVEKPIPRSEAEFIKNEATRIIWSSEYRKPASTPECTKYMSLRSGAEKTNLCAENKKASALAYGLINSVSRVFGFK